MKKTIKKDNSYDFDIGDERLNKRANKVASQLGESYGSSMPKAFNSEADLKGAYRFFNNNLVTPQKILEPHIAETLERIKQVKSVLCIQDSTDWCFDHVSNLTGLTKLHRVVQKGFRLHPILTLNENGVPLGILEAEFLIRKKNPEETRSEKQIPFEEKESYRWMKGYLASCEVANKSPETEVICISDREGDIYDCFLEAKERSENKAHILVRAQYNRTLESNSDEETQLFERIAHKSTLYTSILKIKPSGNRKKRDAHVEIKAAKVTLKPPKTPLKKELNSISVNVVMVTETNPPEGEDAICWILITTLPIDNLDQIKRIIKLYGLRWKIEIYFKTLKSGTKLEETRFEDPSRIFNALAVCMIVSWRVMLMTFLAREIPDEDCTIIFTELEWKLAYIEAYHKTPPDKCGLGEAVKLIAKLGGYLGRKCDGPPGTLTVWRGIMVLTQLVKGYKIAKEIGGI